MTNVFMTEGKIRTIECDAAKYPNYEDINKAIKNGDAIISDWKKNLIPLSGKTAIARRIGGIGLKTNEGRITYGAVGTGAVAPSASSTTLSNEIFRKELTSSSYTDNTVLLRMYFSPAEANGTLTNFGLFGEDATGAADSGILMEIASISKVKTTARTLTVEVEITIT